MLSEVWHKHEVQNSKIKSLGKSKNWFSEKV